MPGILTITDLCKLVGARRHVVRHAIETYGPEPAGRVGMTRYWNADDLPTIRESLAKSDAELARCNRKRAS